LTPELINLILEFCSKIQNISVLEFTANKRCRSKDKEEVPEQFPKLPFLPRMHLRLGASNWISFAWIACSIKFACYIYPNSYKLTIGVLKYFPVKHTVFQNCENKIQAIGPKAKRK
jgi:hypothetical protein